MRLRMWKRSIAIWFVVWLRRNTYIYIYIYNISLHIPCVSIWKRCFAETHAGDQTLKHDSVASESDHSLKHVTAITRSPSHLLVCARVRAWASYACACQRLFSNTSMRTTPIQCDQRLSNAKSSSSSCHATALSDARFQRLLAIFCIVSSDCSLYAYVPCVRAPSI